MVMMKTQACLMVMMKTQACLMVVIDKSRVIDKSIIELTRVAIVDKLDVE